MDIKEESRKLAIEFSEKYGIPSFEGTEVAVKKGLEMAKKLGADERIVTVSCYLMDNGLGEARKRGNMKEHVKISIENAKNFLERFDLSKEDKKKIINSIEAHHGEIKHICIESEIVKNADNFRFLDLKRFIGEIYEGSNKGMSLKEIIKFLNRKVEEKHNLVTLDVCREEAEENYKIIKNLLDRVNLR